MMSFQQVWEWPAGLYLFLGGLAAGAFVAASLLRLLRLKGQEPAVTVSYWLSVVCLAGGLLALLYELGRPERGVQVWVSFSNGSSWMAFGAWVVVLAFSVFLLAAILSIPPLAQALALRWEWFGDYLEHMRTAASVLGSVLALLVACYTGMLLKGAEGVPFWDSWLLPALFAVSAMAAGANAVAMISVATGCVRWLPLRVRRRIILVVMVLTVVEGTILAAYLLVMADGGGGAFAEQRAAAAASADALVSGAYAGQFWIMVVVTGLVASLALSAASCLLKGRAGGLVLAVGSVCALSGECALRFLVLFAGIHADYVVGALITIL